MGKRGLFGGVFSGLYHRLSPLGLKKFGWGFNSPPVLFLMMFIPGDMNIAHLGFIMEQNVQGTPQTTTMTTPPFLLRNSMAFLFTGVYSPPPACPIVIGGDFLGGCCNGAVMGGSRIADFSLNVARFKKMWPAGGDSKI